jgi:uncharacterized protein YecE (DUF72 family)
MTIHIGCSGWHYKHWLGDFYPAGTKPAEFLSLYLKYFDTVEINNSFYRLPTENALETWRDSVPAHFHFSVKASRFITHNKKLKDGDDSFLLFFDRIKLLKDRLGPILFQLPPNWKYNGERLKEFLMNLPCGHDYVFEFRNRDWLREEMFDLLRKYHIGFCIHDMPESLTPEVVTAKLVYIRFHGNGAKYGGGYPDEILEQWAKKIMAWNKDRIKIFVYFNNDIGGFAPRNALTLKDMVNDCQ